MSAKALTVEQIMEQIMAMSDEERGDLMECLQRKICMCCGTDAPQCQCWNDE